MKKLLLIIGLGLIFIISGYLFGDKWNEWNKLIVYENDIFSLEYPKRLRISDNGTQPIKNNGGMGGGRSARINNYKFLLDRECKKWFCRSKKSGLFFDDLDDNQWWVSFRGPTFSGDLEKIVESLKFKMEDKYFRFECSYRTDDNHAYYKSTIIENADRESFEEVSCSYAKDKNTAYIRDKELPGEVDPKTFEVLDSSLRLLYARDKNHVWFSKNEILGITDPSTFELIEGTYYAKDVGSVFLQGSKVHGLDPNTLQVINRKYAKDQDSVFYEWDKIEDADPGSFEVLKHGYSKDKNHVYYYLKKLDGFSPENVKVLPSSSSYSVFVYVKNDEEVFYRSMKIEGADAGSFKLLKESGRARDKNNTYYAGDRESEIPQTWKKSFLDWI